MIRSQGHSGDSGGLIFPAIIVSSLPMDRPDDPEVNDYRFPRIYEWLASSTAHVAAEAWVRQPRTYAEVCLNALEPRASWATNVSELLRDPLVSNRPVPNGTPVTICIGLREPLHANPPACDTGVPLPWALCNTPYGLWFSHYVDPLSLLCNG